MPTLHSPTGTLAYYNAYALSFALGCTTQLILSNPDSGTGLIYILLNDSATAPTASPTTYDLFLANGERFVFYRDFLSLYPVWTLGVYATAGTLNVRGV